MTLIHTAFQSEAQSIIEFFKLKLLPKHNKKIYINDKIILIVSGIGEKNTIKYLSFVFNNFQINKAINIGIVGCSNLDINIGELFCTNRYLDGIRYKKLKTVKTAQLSIATTITPDTLYDMEGKYFEENTRKYLNEKDIYVFKVVSDYLDDTIPKKEFVKQLIQKNIKSIEKWI